MADDVPGVQALPAAPTIYMAHDEYAAMARAHIDAWANAVAQLNAVGDWLGTLTGADLPAVSAPAANPNAAPDSEFAELADLHVAGWQNFADQVNAFAAAVHALLPVDAPPAIADLPPAPSIASPYNAYAALAKDFAAAWPAFAAQLNAAFAWISSAAATAPGVTDFADAFNEFADNLPAPTFAEE